LGGACVRQTGNCLPNNDNNNPVVFIAVSDESNWPNYKEAGTGESAHLFKLNVSIPKLPWRIIGTVYLSKICKHNQMVFLTQMHAIFVAVFSKIIAHSAFFRSSHAPSEDVLAVDLGH
jgi:hypothetical protein